MVKYFCDKCNIEVENPAVSLDMTGRVLCFEHFTEHEKNKISKWNTKNTDFWKQKRNNWNIKIDMPINDNLWFYGM